MPFTFCHPAIVLPFGKLSPKYISMTGLIIGSTLPDFEYFLRLELIGTHGHTLPGIFYMDLPLGIMLCFIFHNIVRNSLIDSLPSFLYHRLSILKDINWNRYFLKNMHIVIISLLLGILSHIFWDAFTHPSGFFVERIDLLNEYIKIVVFQIPIYKILQHGGTLTGGLFILLYVLKMPLMNTERHSINYYYWGIYISIALILVALKMIFMFDTGIGELIATGIAACLLSLIITPPVMKYGRKFITYKY
jgi:hypothetical protein